MFIRWRRRFTCLRTSQLPIDRQCRSQQGIISVGALCLLLVMMGFGLALLYFVRQMWVDNQAYQQEMTMRLAAESAVECQAADFERSGHQVELLPLNKQQRLAVTRPVDIDGLEVTVTGLRQADCLLLIGCALWRPEGEHWEHKKIVRGILRKYGSSEEEKRYVWCGWTQ